MPTQSAAIISADSAMRASARRGEWLSGSRCLRCALAKEAFERAQRHRLAPEPALAHVTSCVLNEFSLLRRLHPFSDHVEAEFPAEGGAGANRLAGVAVAESLAYEPLVDLHFAERHAHQRQQAGMAGAEVVDRQADTADAQPGQQFHDPRRVRDRG